MTGTASEEWRAVCEARDWLRKGYTTAVRVDVLMARITLERSKKAADELRDEMRRQWKCRRDWLGPDL